MKRKNTNQVISSLNDPAAPLFFDEVDWGRLIPAVIDLVRHLQTGDVFNEWEKTLQMISEIINILTRAEQMSGLRIDWSKLIQMIIEILLPILIGGQDPIEV